MLKSFRKTVIGVVCVIVIVALIAVFGDGVQNFSAKYEGYDLTADVSGLGRSNGCSTQPRRPAQMRREALTA